MDQLERKHEMSTNIEALACGLSERMCKENDLSDMTYALCVGNSEFFQFFLDFFFRDSHLNAKEVDISREWDASDNGRPDFCIQDKVAKRYFFVEAKLWDRNLHFKKYCSELKSLNEKQKKQVSANLGYIAAYKIDKAEVDGCSVHTWLEFYTELKKLAFLNDPAIKCYCTYLCSVAGAERADQSDNDIKEYATFNGADFIGIRKFMEEIETAVGELKSEGVSLYTRGKRNILPGTRMGRFIEISNVFNDKSVWAWIGAFYGFGKPEVCLWFEDRNGWGKLVCDKYRNVSWTGSEIEYDNEGLYFHMLDTDGSIKDFIKRVVEDIRGNKTDLRQRISSKVDKKYEFILAMRRFPLWIERKFLDLESPEFSIKSISSDGDSDDPAKHCGRYFTVEQCGGKNKLYCWVGVLFGKDERAEEHPRIEFQVWDNDRGMYKCVAELGKDNIDMNIAAEKFNKKLRDKCSKIWPVKGVKK